MGDSNKNSGDEELNSNNQKTTSKTNISTDDLDQKGEVLFTPPDGGYGWLVVLASFFTNMIVDGVCYSFGVFFLEFLDYFREGRSKTAWVGSLLPGIYLAIGPFVGALANKYGCRPVTIAGSLISSLAFFLATFSPNVDVLILTYGVLGGIGFGLMYLPSVILVGFYFEKKRALATGIAVCGTGIGTFVFAPLSQFLIATYGWKGGLLIMSGICLNGCVCGALFRPLSQRNLKHIARQKLAKKLAKEQSTNSKILKKIKEGNPRVRVASKVSFNDNGVTKDSGLDQTHIDTDQQEIDEANKPLLDQKHPNNSTDTSSNANKECSDDTVLYIKNKHLNKAKYNPLHKSMDTVLLNDTHVHVRTYSEDNGNITQSRDIGQIEAARPMYRKDVLYAGSVASLAEFKESQDIHTYVNSITNIPPEKATGLKARCTPFTSILLQMFDITLLRSVTFFVFMVSNFMSNTGFFTPFVYTTSLAIDLGISDDKAAFLISILGIFNTVGRIIAGLLSDRPWAKALYISLGALTISGSLTCAVPFMNSYPMLATYCATFGFCIASFVVLRSIILVELLGLDKLTNSFGILLLISGIAAIIGSPFAGFLVDVTKSYSLSFIISGVMIAVSGVMLVPLQCIARWETARERRREANKS